MTMINEIRELNINELDAVRGSAGSLGDVATYVKSYTAALGAGTGSEEELGECGENLNPGAQMPSLGIIGSFFGLK